MESFYSTMNAQSMHGGQDPKTLALRSKLEWSLLPIMQAGKVVSKTAQIYIDGDKKRNLKSHRWPTIGYGTARKLHFFESSG